MIKSHSRVRIAVALSLAALWLVGDLGAPLLAKRGLEPGVGRVGRAGRDVHVHSRRNVNVYGGGHRGGFWDEVEDEHQQRMAVGIIGGIVVGALIAKPPKNSQPTQVGGQQYYYSDGNYYEPKGDQYEVVSPPMGAEVDRLPASAQEFTAGDVDYMVVGETYYRVYFRGSEVVYQVVPNPLG